MAEDQYQYDIAISFVAKHEPLATQIADALEGRFKVFLYSCEQNKLVGTDGEQTFKLVFGQQARLVIILYTEEWGKTPWTRFEEQAIRDRAFETGYDFTIFIPLDGVSKLPPWIPKNRLWLNLERSAFQVQRR